MDDQRSLSAPRLKSFETSLIEFRGAVRQRKFGGYQTVGRRRMGWLAGVRVGNVSRNRKLGGFDQLKVWLLIGQSSPSAEPAALFVSSAPARKELG